MINSRKPVSPIEKNGVPLLFLFTVITWLPVLLVQFINDDIQILGYHSGKTLINIFQPFWKPDISGVYWRPVGNLIHPLIIYVAGFHPVPFRLVSLLSYLFCCIVFYYTCRHLGLSRKVSLASSLLFAAMPTHEFQVAWIADTGESLVTAFLLLTLIFYDRIYKSDQKPLLMSAAAIISFITALLIKEVAFSGVLIPFFALAASGDYRKHHLRRAVRDFVLGVMILTLVLLYRYFVIGGTPFGSSHFQDSGPVKWVLNFFTYAALSLFPPEALEIILFYAHNIFVMIFIAAAIILIGYYIFRTIRIMNPRTRRIIIAGAVWFVIFVLPALPTLMRWYVFTASIGIVWIIAAFLEYIFSRKHKHSLIPLLIIILLALAVYDFSLMLRWKKTSELFSAAYHNLHKISTLSEEMTIWGVPDKINRIPMMKLGIAETVQSAFQDTTIKVYAPLRMELRNELSRMELISKENGVLKFRLRGGRFLIERGQSKAIFRAESIKEYYEGYRFIINNSELESTAEIHFNNLEGAHYYFDGERFRRFVTPMFIIRN